jgi:hypothetical protein
VADERPHRGVFRSVKSLVRRCCEQAVVHHRPINRRRSTELARIITLIGLASAANDEPSENVVDLGEWLRDRAERGR